jgi:chemotaxis protein histidine kinase CheA
MAEEHLPNLNNLIDGLRTRLHEELEVQLRGMAESHARALEHARQAADAEAEDRCAARLDVVRGEYNTRLETAVANARAEAERAGAAETMRVRVEGEQAAVESAAAARRELEQSFAVERQQIQSELEAERRRVSELEPVRQRVAELEAELQRTASEREAHLQRVSQLEAEVQRQSRELDAGRQRVVELEADRQRVRELTSERERSVVETGTMRERVAELEAQARSAGDLATERDQLKAQLASERQRAEAQLQVVRDQSDADLRAERESAARALSHASAASERQRQEPDAATAENTNGRAHGAPLMDALRAVEDAGSLTDLLAAAVRGAAVEARRAALFVVQGTELREWPVDGVPSVDSSPLRVDGREAGVIAEALRRHRPAATGGAESFSPPFFASLPPGGVAVAVPLVLGGTPVAVLYADQPGDAAGPSWQENVQILGRHAATCAASLTAVRTAQAMRMISGRSTDQGETDAADQLQAARRYARLLVSEIKLYNEGAVRIGRERRDLLVRLEAEIERARRLFDERVSASLEGRDTLFQQELAQTLADGDPALLGEPRHQRSSWT